MKTPIANLNLTIYQVKKFFQGLSNYGKYQFYFLHSLAFSFSGLITLLLSYILTLQAQYGLVLFACLATTSYSLFLLLLGKQKFAQLKYLQGRAQLMANFFNILSTQLDSSTSIDGHIDCDSFQGGHVYKSKVQLNQQVHYFEFEWCVLAFKLKNGNSVIIKIIDKVLEKKGQLPDIMSRKLKVKLDDDSYELFLYDTYLDKFHSRKSKFNIPVTKTFLIDESIGLATRLYESLMPAINKTRRVKKKQVDDDFDKTIQTERHALFLEQSKLNGLMSSKVDSFSFIIRFSGKKINLEAKKVKGNLFSILSIPMPHLSIKDVSALLKANPSMAYGRFAYDGERVILLKSLIYETLDQEELDTAINGISKLATLFQSVKDIQKRVKKSSHIREKLKEFALIKRALTRVNASIQKTEDNYKAIITLPSGRTQTIFINFDRRDINGEPLISVITQCGHYDEQHNLALLKQNARAGYGAMGILTIEGEEHFVVTDCHLAATVDPLELSGLILNLATKGDHLEKKLSTEDVY